VSSDRTARYKVVDATMINTRTGRLLTRMQTTTGARSRKVMMPNIKALAIFLVNGLEDM
jgi:hypothetical protein